MVAIKDKAQCCGCNACGDACPQKCIRFETDVEGFWYPEADSERCVACGRCEEVCPVTHALELKHNDFGKPECYAAEHRNLEVVFDSTSGGAFSALADVMYGRGGYVGGAVGNADFSVSQFVSADKKDLLRLRSSKYIESSAEGFYRDIKSLCDAGADVFVCGTPCQMAALRAFLGKDYPKLVIADFVCLGVNSPKISRKFLDSIGKKYGSPVVGVKAKSKEYGWRNLTTKFSLADGRTVFETRYTNRMTHAYIRTHAFCRPSCYECKFKGFPRMADITLGDFWGIEKYAKDMDKDLGISLVLVNSQKGRGFFEKAKMRMNCRPMPFESILAGNPALVDSCRLAKGFDRESFFEDSESLSFDELFEKYIARRTESAGERMKAAVRKRCWRMRQTVRNACDLGFNPFLVAGNMLLNMYIRNPRKNRRKGNVVFRHTHTSVHIERSASISLGGRLIVGGAKKLRRSSLETRFFVGKGADVRIKSDFCIAYGSDIEVFDGAKLEIGGRSEGIMQVPGSNVNFNLICADKIEIGRDVMIGRNVTIRDNNGGHYMNLPGYRNTRPVVIGNKAWLCEGCTIMPGAKIGDGAVVGAGSVVWGKIPANSFVAGNPARVVETNVLWKY